MEDQGFGFLWGRCQEKREGLELWGLYMWLGAMETSFL